MAAVTGFAQGPGHPLFSRLPYLLGCETRPVGANGEDLLLVLLLTAVELLENTDQVDIAGLSNNLTVLWPVGLDRSDKVFRPCKHALPFFGEGVRHRLLGRVPGNAHRGPRSRHRRSRTGAAARAYGDGRAASWRAQTHSGGRSSAD